MSKEVSFQCTYETMTKKMMFQNGLHSATHVKQVILASYPFILGIDDLLMFVVIDATFTYNPISDLILVPFVFPDTIVSTLRLPETILLYVGT